MLIKEHVRSYENVFLHRMGILPLINSESKNLENLRTKNQRIVENFEHSQAGKHDSTKSLDLNNFFSNTNINSRQELLDNLRLVSIHPVMNVAKWLLFQLILDPKSSPAHLSHATIYPCAPKKFINQLDLPNRYGAYAFLLDQSSKIRWRASGKGTSEEISSLDSHISALLESSAHRTQPVDPTFNN